MAQNNRSPTLDARIGICGMGCDLFVPDRYEVNGAICQGGKDCNVGVSTQAEDMLDVPSLQETDNVFGNGLATFCGTVHQATSLP